MKVEKSLKGAAGHNSSVSFHVSFVSQMKGRPLRVLFSVWMSLCQ